MARPDVYGRSSIVGISLYPAGGMFWHAAVIGESVHRRRAMGYGYYEDLAVADAEKAPERVRIGAHGLLHGKGKTPIGRGL